MEGKSPSQPPCQEEEEDVEEEEGEEVTELEEETLAFRRCKLVGSRHGDRGKKVTRLLVMLMGPNFKGESLLLLLLLIQVLESDGGRFHSDGVVTSHRLL